MIKKKHICIFYYLYLEYVLSKADFKPYMYLIQELWLD